MAKTNWKNLPDTSTPILADPLNVIENGLINVGTEIDDEYRANITHSRNLFDISKCLYISGQASSLTLSNGVLTATGSSNAHSEYSFGVQIGKTYTISWKNATGFGSVQALPSSSGTQYARNYDTTGSITFTSTSSELYLKILSSGTTLTITDFTINEGSTALTPYEPYVQPSINVDSEQLFPKYNGTIYANDFKCKNLLSIPNGTYSNNGVTAVVDNGVITLSGTANGTSFINIPLTKAFDVLANVPYSISANNSSNVGQTTSGTWAGIRPQTSISDSDTQNLDFSIVNNGKKVIYSSNKTMTYFTIRTASGLGYSNMTIKPQFEIGDEVTPFTPYKNFDNTEYVLWTNPTPNAAFSGQQITLSDDIENYQKYEVIYKIYYNSAGVATSGKLPITTSTLFFSDQYARGRNITAVSGNKITFGSAYFFGTYGNGNTTTNNDYIVPVQVIGYK